MLVVFFILLGLYYKDIKFCFYNFNLVYFVSGAGGN